MSLSRHVYGFYCVILIFWLAAAETVICRESRMSFPRKTSWDSELLEGVLQENALFFNMLVSFSFTAAIAEPYWGVDAKDINLNLVTRDVRDERGRQLVRVRIAGVVRRNNNVELDILDEHGSLVGRGFFGYQSGQLTFYDLAGRAIIDGYMDSVGNFFLDDLRLPEGQQTLSSGYVDSCIFCTFFRYGWYDRYEFQIGGGGMYSFLHPYDSSRVRMYWSFETGQLGESHPAYGEADYDLAREVTGAINSVLFDRERAAASFFTHPYNLVPRPAGTAFFPRLKNGTAVAVTNPLNREIEVTYAARSFDGSLISGEGIENPVTYLFAGGQHYAAFPHEIFGPEGVPARPLLGRDEVGWLEVFSRDAELQTMFLEEGPGGRGLDGGVGQSGGSSSLLLPHLQIGAGESTEIDLLNLSHDDAAVRLELLDARGGVLRVFEELFIAGLGVRHFELGVDPLFLDPLDSKNAKSLSVTYSGSYPGYSDYGEFIGLATYRDGFGSVADIYASTTEAAGPVLVGPFFINGPAAGGRWETAVRVGKLDSAGPGAVALDLFDGSGRPVYSAQESVPPSGQATFSLRSIPSLQDRLTSGYVRISSSSGAVAGDVSIRWSNGSETLVSTYRLGNYLYGALFFSQVAHGMAGTVEYWTGLAVLNDLEKGVSLTLDVFRPDGVLERSARISLQPFEQIAMLLSEILGEPGYTRLDGYMRLSASDPISAIVLFGDTGSRFLSAVPAVPIGMR